MVASRRVAALVAPSLALFLAACGVARVAEGEDAAAVCTGCHGDPARASSPAAPPGDAHGYAASAAVGAHVAHLEAGVTCDTCHVVPVSISAPGHADGGAAEIVFGPAAARHGASPEYVRESRTCRNTYCHGGSRTYAANESAPWDAGDLGCTACHGTPPASHGDWAANCWACHSGTVALDNTLLTGGGHLDGAVSGHAAGSGLDDPAVHGPVAIEFLSGEVVLGACTSCHGLDFGGGESGVSCNGCHASRSTAAFPSGVADWRANCTFCHGTPTEPYGPSANPVLAAPPEDVAGSAATADRSVGAHRTHLFGRSANPISDGVTCADCHAVPANLDHVDGHSAVVTKRAGTATTVGSYDPVAGTCTNTYCHGNLPRNARLGNSPSWTATSGQTACGTCHAPQWAVSGGTRTGKHGAHDPGACDGCHDDGRPDCSMCHASYSARTSPATVNHPLHVNGAVDAITDPFVGWSAENRSCSPGCHTIADHDVSNPKSW